MCLRPSFPCFLQWNPWFTGVTRRSLVLSSEPDWLFFWPWSASLLSVSSPTFRWPFSWAPLSSQSTRMSCKPFRRHQKDIPSSKSWYKPKISAVLVKELRICIIIITMLINEATRSHSMTKKSHVHWEKILLRK